MNRILAPTAIVAALLAPCGALTAQTVTANDVMRIHFRMNTPLNGTPDVLNLNFGLLTVNQAYGTRTARLWDCGKPLGTASSSSFGTHVGRLNLDPSNSWTTTSSPWTFDSPGIVNDFTSIQNGTIQGIIDFTIASGSVTIPLGQVNLNMIRATSGSGGSVVSPAPTITEIAIVPKLDDPVPGVTGQINAYNTTGGSPGNIMWLAFGGQCAVLPLPCLPAATFDVLPIVFVPTMTDPSGNSSFSVGVPPSISGQTILVQGLQFVGTSCLVTNISAFTFP